MTDLQAIVERIYHLILCAYPPEYLETFGDEMQNTLLDGLEESISQGMVASFLMREMSDTPKSLVYAYWCVWSRKIVNGIELFQKATSSSDLPSTPPDGRDSWRQVFLELSMFFVAGILLIIATYNPVDILRSDRTRNFELFGHIIVSITVPFLLFGLMRGLPRWAYPIGGMLVGYGGYIADRTGLWLFLIMTLFASLILFLTAILTDPQPSRLPISIRRIGQSISLDWTRLSFGVYGAMPLAILMAFDDAHTNRHTPYFAFSLLVMFICALVYCRSRDTTIQITTLLTGLTFSIWCAWLDKVSFTNGLTNWTKVSTIGVESIVWMAILWLQWAVLISFPIVFILLNKLVHLKRAV
jgi:hypothetical protein